MTKSEKIEYANSKLKAVRAAIDEAIASGAASASISGGAGSRSYSRIPLSDLRKEESRWIGVLRSLRSSSGTGIRHIGFYVRGK